MNTFSMEEGKHIGRVRLWLFRLVAVFIRRELARRGWTVKPMADWFFLLVVRVALPYIVSPTVRALRMLDIVGALRLAADDLERHTKDEWPPKVTGAAIK